MAIATKDSYPRALPSQSHEELTRQNARLKQANDELAGQTRGLQDQIDQMAQCAVRWRRWTVRLAGLFVAVVLLVAGAITLKIQFPGLFSPAPTTEPVVPSEPVQTKDDSKPVVIAQVKSNAPTETHIKKPVLALPANARPDAVVAKDPAQKASFLEALGGLSVAHLYQTHLNIGLLADGVESETYTVEEAEKNLKSVIDLMKMVDGQLANVSKSGIDAEDQESIRDLQAIAALLHLQTTALRAYWADGDMEQAANYHKARKGAWQGLSKVMGIEP